jgi:L-lysine exporter family protein LysE/ArgO
MTIPPLLHGFLLALGLVLPIGPQNLYILQQGAAQRSWRRTVPAVIAAAFADTAMIVGAVTGTSLLLLRAPLMQRFVLMGGIAFLLYMGWIQWNSNLTVEALPESRLAVMHQIGTALAVSLLNPHAILDSMAVLGPSSLFYSGMQRWYFAIGCIANSWIWFVGLAFVGRLIGARIFSERHRRLTARIAGVLLWSSAVYLLFVLTG